MGGAKELGGPDLAAGIALDDVPEGPLVGHARGEAVLLVRRGATIDAIGATCSHYGGPLGEGLVVGDTVRCPWHHACFDLRTGEAVGAPALAPIACYEVRVAGGRVAVGERKAVPAPPPPPPLSPESIVVVGAGAAGAAAVERARALGYRGPIALVGDEDPVDRPNLSKDYLAGTAPEEWIPLRSPDFYREIGVERVAEPAAGIDPGRRSVALAGGRVLPYGALLLATGAEPLRLAIEGAAPPGAFTLRSLADARAIIAAAASARRAAVIGSSFIGLEVAASLRARGLAVEVVSRDRVPLERVLGPEVGRFVQELHEERGVRFHLGASPAAVRADGVLLADGRLVPGELVVLGVGVRPRTALAERAGLAVDDGITVDAFLRTSAPGVWAAGDVARYPEPRLGERARIEHWTAAERQGQAAARSILGLGEPFRDVPFFWSQHYDVTLSCVGHARAWDAIEVRGDLARRDAAVVYRRGGRALFVVAVGRDRQALAVEAAMERGSEAGVEEALRA